jgi:hypothetical protein
MSDDISARIAAFNELVRSAQVLLSIARDSDLQQAMLASLSELSTSVAGWKAAAVAEGNEVNANLFLGMECLLKALHAELEMWLMLKRQEPELAWDHLITAQTATCHALRAAPGFSSLESHATRLDAIEKVVFPPQVFVSAGLIVSKAICTICGTDYEECPHLVGLPYWGEFCFRKLTDVAADHVAIVADPANKRCRMTHFSDEEGRRNRMTWRVEAVKNSDDSPASAIIMSTDDLLS